MQSSGTTKRERTLRLAGSYAPIVQRAFRLHDDATLLRASRKYPSATALAVLSMEEVGKLMLHHEAFEDHRSKAADMPSHPTRSHSKKQKLTAGLLVGNLLISEVEHLIRVANQSRLDDLRAGSIDRAEMTRLIGSIDRYGFNEVPQGRMKNYKHHGFLIDFAAGRFDALKQACFYADVDSKGHWADASSKISRAIADKICKMSGVALNAVYSAMKHHEWRKSHWY